MRFSNSFARLGVWAALLTGCADDPPSPPVEPAQAPPAPAPQAAAPSLPRVIVDVSSGQLFGGVVDGQWLDDKQMTGRVTADDTLSAFTLSGPAGVHAGVVPGPPREFCSNATVRLDAEPGDQPVIAVSNARDAQPRVPTVLSSRQPTYEKAVAAWLRDNGIDLPEVRITQLLRIDLEGDGVDEVLLSANLHRGSATSASSGDYGLVALRRFDGDTVETIALADEYHPQGCVMECAPSQYRVAGLLDLDGDGTLEVIVDRRYYEGQMRTIYTVDDGCVTERLSWVCGP